MKSDHTPLRVFFAIDLPTTIKDTIANHLMPELKKNLPGDIVRWTKPDNLHITLQFIPAFNAIDLQPCLDLLRSKQALPRPFLLTLGAYELFPSLQYPRYIALSMEPQQPLTLLSNQLGTVLEALHYPLESRPFRGHLTLGKITGSAEKIVEIDAINLPTIEPFSVDEVTLFQSHSNKTGSLYTKLATIPLDARN